MLKVEKILHPTDFSSCSKDATELACSLAKEYDARLHLLHVITESSIPRRPGVITLPPRQSHREKMERTLHEISSAHPDVLIHLHLEDGEPEKVILQLAKQVQPDLIVMGTHGRTGAYHLLTGSVAEAVLHKAPCPVVTVRTRHDS